MLSNFARKSKFVSKFFYPKFSFSSQLKTIFGDRQFESEERINLNWELAKVWVNPSNNVLLNTLEGRASGGSDSKDLVTKCSSLDFEKFLRKMGFVISNEKEIYVQDGVYKSKGIRVISSAKEDAESISSIFEGKRSGNEKIETHVLYLTEHPEIGKNKTFVFSDKSRKIVISNSKSLDTIKEKLDKF